MTTPPTASATTSATKPNYYRIPVKANPDVIDIVEALNLPFTVANAVKYLVRAGKKDPAKEIEDLQKAIENLDRRIQVLKSTAKE